MAAEVEAEIMFSRTRGRARARAPLSSVDSNLMRADFIGTPFKSREVKNGDCEKGNVMPATKKRRSKTRRKQEIYTPLVLNDSTNSRRLNCAVVSMRHQPHQPSISSTEESLSIYKLGDETFQSSAGARVNSETAIMERNLNSDVPVASLGNTQQHIILNFGYSTVVGKTQSLPFRVVASPSSTTTLDTEYPIELGHTALTKGFEIIIGGHGVTKHENVACTGMSSVGDMDAPTIFYLKQAESKIIHVLWTPNQGGEFREEIYLKSPWGRFQISVLGIAHDTVQKLTPAKTKSQSNLTTFHARDNITYDSQQWEDRQSATFMIWLNAMFHPEFNRVNDEQILSEWEAAKQLFDSPKMQAIRCSVEREVKYGRLAITPRSDEGHLAMTPGSDRNILDEVNVREQLTELLLSYTPRWLQLGLGIVLAMNCTDIIKVSQKRLNKVILERVLTEPSVVRSCRGKTPSWKFECKMRIALHQHALSQIMILVYFLDSAKCNRVLTEDPCLFEKSSRMKSSEEVLISLCQDCFSMQGSIIKHLDYEGISVCHVQNPLDEYDFHVKNLAVDLKDGVCLAKLIDTVTNTSNLLSLMRLPATTRHDKIYNVNFVLATLRHLGVPNISDITTAHIVAAHQPRILQLLWSTILHFDLPQFRPEIVRYKASRLIQGHVRRFLGTRSYQLTRHETILIQAAYRGFVIRTSARKVKNASTLIQKIWRGYHSKLAYGFSLMGIFTIQRFCRRFIARSQLKTMARNMHSAAIEIQRTWRGHRCVISFGCDLMGIIAIQSICRRLIAKNRIHKMVRKTNSAVNIQKVWRGYYAKMNFGSNMMDRITVQSLCRRFIVPDRAMRKSNTIDIASVNIQRVWRGYNAKLSYGFKLMDIITVQSTCRRFIARKAIATSNACALKIQRYIRMWAARKCYRKYRKATFTIQRYVRRVLASSHDCYLKTHIVHTQRVIRGWLCRKQYIAMKKMVPKMAGIQASPMLLNPIEEYFNPKNMAVKKSTVSTNEVKEAPVVTSFSNIEIDYIATSTSESKCSLRCSSSHDADEISFTTRHASRKRDFDAVGKIAELVHENDRVVNNGNNNTWNLTSKRITSQKNTTPQICATDVSGCMKEPDKPREVTEVDSLFIHRHSSQLKRADAMAGVLTVQAQPNKRENAAAVIQKMYRGLTAHEQFMLTKFAAVMIQSAFRRHLHATNYRDLRKSAILTQALYRGRKARHDVWAELALQRKILYSAMSLHRSESVAATQIQRIWRGYMANVDFMLLMLSIIKIQSLARRRIAAATFCVMLETERRSSAVLTVQRASRAFIRNKRENAAAVIQKMYRGLTAHEQFMLTKFAAVMIQSAFRRHLHATNYRDLRKSAILTQALYRGRKARHVRALALQRKILYSAMSLHRSESVAATQIQRIWRGYMANVDFMLLMLSIIKIQSLARRRIAATKYHYLRICMVHAQAYFRGYKARQHASMRRQKAVMMQAVVRQFLAKLERARILTAMSTLQRAARGMIVRMQVNVEVFAATEIQRSWRGYRANVNFLLTVVSAIKIQSFIRFVLAEAKAARLVEYERMEHERILAEQRDKQLTEVHAAMPIMKTSFECRGVSAFPRRTQSPHTEAESFKLRNAATSQGVGQLPPRFFLTSSVAAATEAASKVVKPPNEFSISTKQLSKFERHTAKAIRTIQKRKSKKFFEVLQAVMIMEKTTRQSIDDCRMIVNACAHQELISIICSCNRSSPHLELIRLILSVLTNLSRHPSLLSRLASKRSMNALTDLVHMFRDKSNILLLSSSLLEGMLRVDHHLVPEFSTPENKKRLRGIVSRCKEKVSELRDTHEGIRCLENLIRICEGHTAAINF